MLILNFNPINLNANEMVQIGIIWGHDVQIFITSI